MTFAYSRRYSSGGLCWVQRGSAYSKQHYEKFPNIEIPIIGGKQPFINLVDRNLAAKAADPNADTSNLENEIDRLVYGLYDLTDDEIAIVEGRV